MKNLTNQSCQDMSLLLAVGKIFSFILIKISEKDRRTPNHTFFAKRPDLQLVYQPWSRYLFRICYTNNALWHNLLFIAPTMGKLGFWIIHQSVICLFPRISLVLTSQKSHSTSSRRIACQNFTSKILRTFFAMASIIRQVCKLKFPTFFKIGSALFNYSDDLIYM